MEEKAFQVKGGLLTRPKQKIRVLEVEAGVAIVVDVKVVVEAKANLEININPRAIFNVDIARNLVTRKQNVGVNREMSPRKPTLQ